MNAKDVSYIFIFVFIITLILSLIIHKIYISITDNSWKKAFYGVILSLMTGILIPIIFALIMYYLLPNSVGDIFVTEKNKHG
jgi:hypothetical protein